MRLQVRLQVRLLTCGLNVVVGDGPPVVDEGVQQVGGRLSLENISSRFMKLAEISTDLIIITVNLNDLPFCSDWS